MKKIKPMLSGVCKDINLLTYPVLVTPKLDGIRCLIINNQAVSRKLKPIPNEYIRTMLEQTCLNGFDGEIIIPNVSFNETQSKVMTENGAPAFKFFVFDNLTHNSSTYEARMKELQNESSNNTFNHLEFLIPTLINNKEELIAYEAQQIQLGYEGVMIRSPKGPYKFGRSTEKEGWLLKLKNFSDSEAIILDFEEKLHNNNTKEVDELGYTKRSSNKENMIPLNTLGSLLVKDCKTNIEFKIGSGFNDEQRKEIWENKTKYLNTIVNYKFQSSGMLEKPRFPTFRGFRHD